MPTVNLSSAVGWERLALIIDLRDARAAGLVRWHDNHVQTRPGLPAELQARMAEHADLLEHALTYDRKDHP